jgi:hypothetical protein
MIKLVLILILLNTSISIEINKNRKKVYKQAEFAASKYSRKFNTHYKLHGILRFYSKVNSIIEFDITAEYTENNDCVIGKECQMFECTFKTIVIPWINYNVYISGACNKKFITF